MPPRRRHGAPPCRALEEILYIALPVLDHGFVRVVDYMGDDAAIVQAARVSYGRGTRRVQDDAGLIDYLMRHRHSTPFEMCEIKYHVKLPIFVARQWIRHRTANVNEYSARYSVLDKEYYLPAPEHLAAQSSSNRQGRGEALPPEHAAARAAAPSRGCRAVLCAITRRCSIPDGIGLARELARIDLTLATYTQWYWKIDLHNLFHFLSLRADAHAQFEIRAYAEAMLETVRRWVPLACAAFVKNRLGAVTLSAPALAVVKRMLAGETRRRSRTAASARANGGS